VYAPPGVSARVRRGCGIAAGIAGSLLLAACGAGTSDGGAGSVHGRFPVTVSGHYAPVQRLAQRTTLRIAVRNTGRRAVPDVAVTICDRSCAASARPDQGTAAQPFGHDIADAPNLANPSRPLWIVNRGPGVCHVRCNAPGGGAGGGVTANSNTWALGRLAPGRTAHFTWVLTPVAAGRHLVAWEIAGNLTGTARAVAGSGGIPHGTFAVSVSSAPPRTRVTPGGKVVTTKGS
jgi:hypothetical protein